MGTHPIMFTEDDPGLAELRRLALALPEAAEQISWGRPVFKAGKIFAMFGGNAKGTMIAHPYSVLVKVDDSERLALVQDERFYYPAYMGPYGWLGLDFAIAEVDWDEVAELLDASYRLIASKRLIKLLDQQL
ncbi:phosphoribosylglycinamide formyltransferase protein [Mycobacteroides abscessus subsp. abscessus]|uniref:MmcQ/YjbR family DNA-binding protein n=1 Tax=Mycobacteroides abscessus TaxID=36809 RepID=UPI00092B6DCA|nr:MmcQ/YjbR family DNA-binding protein [Mycobacteroides abscessus]SHQ61782.1 phosphoribosylglycinamide formyltransferase protein [Mycobacteroides abscessus subsp. abscessus]SHR35054.1 phosphoribosylglycinamide formyltransferase protein [Mycobacteroides abscessus subsp. abscessus]SHZ31880.1 phosphoribosylglycinamide formyltransferase protein [Mycobacteroides abscessus subsp. abscessus]SKE53274.1 phosphoribosylglycinamide formyltransferase protein [Mycobacteroides abscessus subsp. abscessus]